MYLYMTTITMKEDIIIIKYQYYMNVYGIYSGDLGDFNLNWLVQSKFSAAVDLVEIAFCAYTILVARIC